MYVSGTYREYKWSWDVDDMSYIDITKMISFFGYKTFKYAASTTKICTLSRVKAINVIVMFCN